MKMIKSICAIGVAVTVSSTASAAPIFNPATGHLYDFVPAMTWAGAEAAAVAMGGDTHLVTVNDAAEQAWLVGNFGGSERLWIGFNDIAVEGTFVWTSGQPVTYTNWAAGEPNNAGGEDATTMNWSAPGNWNDLPHNSTVLRGIKEWTPGIPEPGTLALFGLGLAGLGLARRKRAA